nr:transposase [Paenibacillus tianjinensis]
MYKTVDELCFKSKNLYNYANYIMRQEFINNGKYINYYDMKKELKTHEPFKSFGSQAAQQTLSVLDEAWKSFFASIKDWGKNKSKYLGMPKMPKYKDKQGRQVVILSNIQFKRIDGCIKFSWLPFRNFKIPTKVTDKLMQIRFVPRGSHYTMEIVYEIDIPLANIESNRIASIDLGIDNFATVSNNTGNKPFIINGKIIKSMNQYYNKKKAKSQSDLMKKNNKKWSNALQSLTDKRANKLRNHIHKSSRYIVDWCADHQIDTLVVGKNKNWKQEARMGKTNNQTFVYIPFEMLIRQLRYKCENIGIKFVETEESYTSGTSFLDEELPIKSNYNKSRRIHRGMFISNLGIKINADLNGSYQIMKKVFPNAFGDGIEGVHLHPVRVNLV